MHEDTACLWPSWHLDYMALWGLYVAVAEVQINLTAGLGSLPCGYITDEGDTVSRRDLVFVFVVMLESIWLEELT